MSKTNWIGFTGMPSSGITTTLKEFEKLGKKVFWEVSREIMEEWSAMHLNPAEERKTMGEEMFQRLSFHRQMGRDQLLFEVFRDEKLFFDRPILDAAPYYEICGANPAEVYQCFACEPNFFRKIFYLESLPWVADGFRTEDPETRERLGRGIWQTYVDLGYEPGVDLISVPVATVAARVQIIEQELARRPDQEKLCTDILSSSIADYAAGTLRLDKVPALEEHLSVCTSCSGILAMLIREKHPENEEGL